MRRSRQRGQSLVEGAFVLLIFFALLFGVIDCGQVLVAHQALVERVRSAVRWGVVHPWDGRGDQVANLVLFGDTREPASSDTAGFLGLTRANVKVRYQPGLDSHPDDEMLSVEIVDYHYQFLSPWVTSAVVNPRPVLMSAPMAYRAVAAR